MFESKIMRNNELMRDYRRTVKEVLAAGQELNREKAIRKMLTESTPNYHVSYNWAMRLMHDMIEQRKPCPAKGVKREMWEEIKRHVETYMDRHGKNLADAVTATLINKRASRYFLSYKQASKIIYHECNKNRNSNSSCRA